MTNKKHVHLIIKGRVQGVFYRASTVDKAQQLNIKGWVRNCANGNVESEAQGEVESVNEFIEWCKIGPQFAKVDELVVKEINQLSEFTSFEIRH